MTETTGDVRGAVIDNCVDVEIDIDAPPAAVFEFLIDPEKLLRWMGEEADIDPQPGGRFWLKLGENTAEGSYVDVTPAERIVLAWGWVGSDIVPPGSSTVTFELTETETGTNVRLTHTGLPESQCDQHLEGWMYFGGRMSVAAAGGDPDA